MSSMLCGRPASTGEAGANNLAGPVPPPSPGRMVGQWKILIRYFLLLAHVALFALTFALSATFIFSLLLCVLLTLWAIPVVIYVPATLILNILGKRTSFDSAGGEVGYLVVEWLMLLAMAIITTYDAAGIPCDKILDLAGALNARNRDTCDKVSMIAILLWVHTAMLVGWMAWIVREVWAVKGLPRGRVYELSMQSLLRAEYNARGTERRRGVEMEELEVDLPSPGIGVVRGSRPESRISGVSSISLSGLESPRRDDGRNSLDEAPPPYSKDPS